MSCRRWRGRLDELARDELPPKVAAALRAHLSACAACAAIHREMQQTLSLLDRLAEEPMPQDFAASLHRRLVASPPPRPSSALGRIWSGLRDRTLARPVASGVLGAALAAALFAVATVGRHPAHRASVAAGEVQPIFFVPKEKVAVVRIDFHAEQPIDDVEFAIRLPDGLHFVSEGRELPDREFRWRGRLERGSNQIPIAVRGRRVGRYTLAAHAVGPDVQARHDVVLEVTSS